MPYITIKRTQVIPAGGHSEYVRVEHKMDIARFAKDLAEALGGTVAAKEKTDTDTWQSIELGRDMLTLYVSGEYKGKVQVNISINAIGVKPGDRSSYDQTHKTPSISVSPDKRTIEAIAKDVRRRVIEPAQEPLNRQREYAMLQVNARGAIVEHAEALRKLAPGLKVTIKDGAQTADVWGSSGGPYVSALLNSNGTVSVSRLESMSAATFAKVYALIKADKP